jgi:hypothetical protein
MRTGRNPDPVFSQLLILFFCLLYIDTLNTNDDNICYENPNALLMIC